MTLETARGSTPMRLELAVTAMAGPLCNLGSNNPAGKYTTSRSRAGIKL